MFSTTTAGIALNVFCALTLIAFLIVPNVIAYRQEVTRRSAIVAVIAQTAVLLAILSAIGGAFVLCYYLIGA